MDQIKLKNFRLAQVYLWTLPRLICVVVLLISLLSYLIYTNFTALQAAKLVKLQQEEVALKNSLVNKFRRVKSLPLYLQKAAELAALESSIKQRLPPAEELPSLLIQINQIAEDANVNLSSFSPKETSPLKLAGIAPKDDKIMAETVALNGVASYANLIKFIYRIAQLPQVFEISQLQLTRISDQSLNLNFDLIIYYSSE